MNVRNLFKLAALSLVVSLAACNNEELLSQSPDGKVELKDGEMAVKLKIDGLGGAVSTRAANDVVLPGEMEIGKLDVYCFVNLSKANISAVEPDNNVDAFTLERVYRYTGQGDKNDLFLTPLGNGYQATFGVLKDTYKRVFVLVANDENDQRANATAVALIDGSKEGEDRSTATELGSFKSHKIEKTDVVDGSANLSTPLIMQSIAGRMVNTAFNPVYTKDDLDTGISATLKRGVSRIDIKNLANNRFTIKSMKIVSAKNSGLFFDNGANQLPQATAADLISFEEKNTGLDTEWLLGAYYAYPIHASADGNQCPKVVITGTMGSITGNPATPGDDIIVEAKFDNQANGAFTNPDGMLPNTRYVVNLLNSGDNVIATISIANWEDGGSLDTDDVIKQLNSEATLTVGANATINLKYTPAEKKIYCFSGHGFGNLDELVATIKGETGNGKPIGIFLTYTSPYGIGAEVEDKGLDGSGTRTYELRLKTGWGSGFIGVSGEAKLSLVTYDAATDQRVINEYLLYRDRLDVTTLTGSLNDFKVFTQDGVVEGKKMYKVPAYGAENAIQYCSKNGMDPYPTNLEATVLGDCNWITQSKSSDAAGNTLFNLAIASNVGGKERSAIVRLRMYDNTQPFNFKTEDITIIQEQGEVLSPFLQSNVCKVALSALANPDYIQIAGTKIRMRKNQYETITITGDTYAIDGKPKYFLVKSSDSWIKVTQGVYDAVNNVYKIEVYIDPSAYPRTGKFTVTSANGDVEYTVTVENVDDVLP